MPSNARRKKQNKKEMFFLFLLIVGISYGYYAFQARAGSQGITSAYFLNPSGDKVGPFTLEIADTRGERQRGLMFRKDGDMKPDEGMLFAFPKEEIQSFWMKNTYISLDMIFVDSNRNVVGILSEVPVLNTVPRKVEKPSQYVVELLAGVAQKRGIEKGAKLQLSSDFPVASS